MGAGLLAGAVSAMAYFAGTPEWAIVLIAPITWLGIILIRMD
jgi:hypothetical protein